MLMDQSLEDLYKQGLITREDALAKANDIEALNTQLGPVPGSESEDA